MKEKTGLFVFVSIALFFASWLVYDIYALKSGGTEASISFYIYELSFKNPIFTYVSGLFNGVLVGHFFWRIRDTKKTKEISDQARS